MAEVPRRGTGVQDAHHDAVDLCTMAKVKLHLAECTHYETLKICFGHLNQQRNN